MIVSQLIFALNRFERLDFCFWHFTYGICCYTWEEIVVHECMLLSQS